MYGFEKNRHPAGGSIYLAAAGMGMLAGIGIIQLQSDSAFSGILGEYFLNQYASFRIDYVQMIRYIAGYRLGQYMLLMGAGIIPAAPIWMGFLLFLLGMIWGSVLSISTLQLGFRGIVICVAGLLPQVFFYLPAFGWMILWVICGGNNRKKYLMLGAVGGLFLLFGIFTEACVNPAILRQILGKIV